MTTHQLRAQDHEHERTQWAAVRMEYGLCVEELPEVRARRQRQAATGVPSEDRATARPIVERLLRWLGEAQQRPGAWGQQFAAFVATTREAKRHRREQAQHEQYQRPR